MDVTSLFVAWSLLGQGPVAPAVPFDRGAGGYAPPPAAAMPPAGFSPGGYSPPAGAATISAPVAPAGVLTAGSSPVAGASPAAVAAPPGRAPQAFAPAAGAPLNPGTVNPQAPAGAAASPPEEKTAAGEIVREALNPPKSLGLTGRKTKLVEIMSRAGDRRRQIDAVRAYWRVAAETAEYHFAWQHVQFLKQLAETIRGIEQGPALQTAEAEIGARSASAQAREREQSLRLANAQFDLAETALLGASGGALPLSDDLPHVGTYHTYFDKVYRDRTAPSRIHLLNRSIPKRQEVVAVRADTVMALQDAYDASFDAYRRRQLPLDEVLETLEGLRTGRSEFVTAVRRYNEEIAEYALTSAPEGTTRETLVGMLVKNAHTPVPGKVSWLGEGEGIETVTFLDEFGTPVEGTAGVSAPVRDYHVQPIPDAGISGAAATGPYNPSSYPTGDGRATPSALNVVSPSAGSGTPTLAPAAAAPPNPSGPSYAAPPGYAPPRSAVSPPPNALPAGPYGVSPAASASSYAPPTNGLRPTLAPPLVTRNSDIQPTSFDAPNAATPMSRTNATTSPGAGEPARFEPAPFAQPLDAFPAAATKPTAPSGGSSIQFAPPQGATPATQANQPTLAPPLNPAGGASPYQTKKVPLDGPMSAGTDLKSSGSPDDNSSGSCGDADPPANNPYQSNPMSSGMPETTTLGPPVPDNRSPIGNVVLDEQVEPVGYYGPLHNVPPARRAQELVQMLYSAKAATGEVVRPITLEDCLAAAPDRRRAVAAYWRTAEEDVRRRVAFQTLEQLENLQQLVLRFRDTPAGAVAMLRVQAAKLSADAVRLETSLEWISACGRLTDELHRPLGDPWLNAATLPHAGSYTATAGKSTAANGQARRAAERIPAIHEVLQLRAHSVVAADTAVDFALREYSEGRGTINGVLHAVARQRTETGDLSTVVTRYNLDIADYALSLLPAETPRDTVVAALVVRDATARR